MAMAVGDHDLPKFRADNGTAECAAAPGLFAGKISLLTAVQKPKYPHVPSWEAVTPGNLKLFSAVCW